ncbi:outer membrane protein [Legionella sp.]|uniref:outer membrane protein n=1 Tax=Legionella sp. TaxID=459 RepID=UPI003C8524E4
MLLYKNKKRSWICGAMLSLCSSITQASWYVEGNIGYDFPTVTGSNKIGSGNGWPADIYQINNLVGEPIFGGSLGYEWFFPQRKFLSFFSAAAAYLYDKPTRLTGNVEQFSLPKFNNYIYHYNINRQTLMALFQAGLFRVHFIVPYVSGGLGIAFNQTKPYVEIPSSGIIPRISPDFLGASRSQFSYTVGAGIYFFPQESIALNLGYRYTDFGIVQTGNAQNGYSGYLTNAPRSNSLLMGIQFMFK